MQNLRWLILFVLLLGCANAADVVRLVTWNLEWFPGKKPAASQEERDKHFTDVAAVLRRIEMAREERGIVGLGLKLWARYDRFILGMTSASPQEAREKVCFLHANSPWEIY